MLPASSHRLAALHSPGRSLAARLFSAAHTEHYPEGGLGKVREQPGYTEEEKEVIRRNEAEAKKTQERWMREVDDGMRYRDPDPQSGVNTAGTVTGTGEEYASGRKPRRLMGDSELQDPEDRRAKEELAGAEGYEPPQAHPPPKPFYQVFDTTKEEAAPSSEDAARSTPDRVGRSVVHMLKEAVDTMMHGVNNAGQPEMQQKLKEVREEEKQP